VGMPAPHQTIAISQLASAHAMNNADSYKAKELADAIAKNGLCNDPLWPKESRELIVTALRAYAAATEIQGDDEVLKYVTSGNAIPVTRCTVSADLIRQLVADRSSGPSHKPAAVEALKGVLDEIEDYLEQRQDVRDGSDGPRANTEMSLLSDLRWWRDSAGMCSATHSEGETK
jgi:hypothetical protein